MSQHQSTCRELPKVARRPTGRVVKRGVDHLSANLSPVPQRRCLPARGMVPRRVSRRLVAVTIALTLLCLYRFLASETDPQRSSKPVSARTPDPDDVDEPAPFCPPLPGIEDLLVVMKTGVTESREKVPIHFSTTLRCIPHYVIFSDMEEEIEGVQIHDALKGIDREVLKNPDFNIYNRIAKNGREGLEQQDFADEANSAIGKPNNPGWKLDKWKFLPMAQQALRYRPEAKWFVFIEADTYVSWPTLLAWLARFDARKPLYLGTETQIADTIFAHGGSGFMLSHPALQSASDQYAAREKELNAYTDQHWAGDCVLGKVLADAGINLHYSWPILQNSNLGELDEFTRALYRDPWCFLSVALHHLTPSEIEKLWKFELSRWNDKNKRILLHNDIFREYIYPEIATQPIRFGWDNLSKDEHPLTITFEDCRELCESEKACVQFAFRDNLCVTSTTPRLGIPHPGGAVSGWLTSRIEPQMDKKGLCRKPQWGD
ncbi:hypothetical protein NUU61_000561 [Penicillium alfredii]|uniref:N-acetylgalactosaminide beta-1,3-galactosyltransferase n=1 Tax=Penicillium alfredii TaxID=1506179 RepID=A0A9W9GB16_9EURO|nr:uncharacterized protein NUU61_000561 [Penicillium alfredii]KAJ5114802.1 hypothetical protein NUU61_000561 [Penicillium alfredii]